MSEMNSVKDIILLQELIEDIDDVIARTTGETNAIARHIRNVIIMWRNE